MDEPEDFDYSDEDENSDFGIDESERGYEETPESKDDIIADEEKEIQKIVEEGEKAAREAEAQKPAEPENPEGGSSPVAPEEKPAERGGLWKWFFAGIGLVIIVGGIFFAFNHISTPKLEDLQHTGPLAKFDPSEFLSGWKLNNEYLTFADLPMDKRKEFVDMQNLTDVATWEFSKGDDTVFVWIRQFSDEASAKIGAGAFSPTAWRNVGQSALSFGDEGKVGIYRITGNDPLLAYVWQNDIILSAAYYNTDNKQYDATKLLEDKVFLTKLAKDIMIKIVSETGQELKVAEIA